MNTDGTSAETSSDKDKYYRAGIAMPMARKPEYDRRMAALGLKTIGELANMFTTMPGVVEALAPIAEQFRAQSVRSRLSEPKRKAMIEQLTNLSADELNDLMRQAGLPVVAQQQAG